MTFYEQELQKIVGERYPDATYVGRTCYVQLGDMNRAKIEFVKGIQDKIRVLDTFSCGRGYRDRA